jgi:hypothetical protein
MNLKSLLKTRIPVASSKLNLFQLCSLLPKDGINARVKPVEWTISKAAENSFYEITHVTLSPGFTQGIVCGRRVVNGKVLDSLPKPIPQNLSKKLWIPHK